MFRAFKVDIEGNVQELDKAMTECLGEIYSRRRTIYCDQVIQIDRPGNDPEKMVKDVSVYWVVNQ